jgi:hypothetical protein
MLHGIANFILNRYDGTESQDVQGMRNVKTFIYLREIR